jgi:hypothetical protein
MCLTSCQYLYHLLFMVHLVLERDEESGDSPRASYKDLEGKCASYLSLRNKVLPEFNGLKQPITYYRS